MIGMLNEKRGRIQTTAADSPDVVSAIRALDRRLPRGLR